MLGSARLSYRASWERAEVSGKSTATVACVCGSGSHGGGTTEVPVHSRSRVFRDVQRRSPAVVDIIGARLA